MAGLHLFSMRYLGESRPTLGGIGRQACDKGDMEMTSAAIGLLVFGIYLAALGLGLTSFPSHCLVGFLIATCAGPLDLRRRSPSWRIGITERAFSGVRVPVVSVVRPGAQGAFPRPTQPRKGTRGPYRLAAASPSGATERRSDMA
jgi:hypothetical protein